MEVFFWFGKVCLEIYDHEIFISLVSLCNAKNNKFQNRQIAVSIWKIVDYNNLM